MNNSKLCQTNLIVDKPSDHDVFCNNQNNGAHKNLAETIAQFILKENGGIVIGLEGTWGSGKSTVIRLLHQELENSAFIFSFDAWSHEGDPLRRIFIERLKTFAEEIMGKDIKWTDELNSFPNNHIQTKTIHTRTLTKLGIIFSFVSILLPISLLLLKNGLDLGITFSGKVLNWSFIIGLLFSLLPFFTLLYALGSRKKNNISESDFISLILQDPQKPITIADSYSSGNPTTVEFENYFLEIVNKILSQTDRKFVVIIDNIDRVSPEKSIEILNSLQMFIQTENDLSSPSPNSNYKKKGLDRLWTILPYDYDGLCKIWENHKDNPTQTDTTISSSSHNNHSLAISMIEKKIPVRFFVPPIILSTWKEFFLKSFDEAFPNHVQDKNDVFSIYLKSLKESFATPTPRDIINYINLIGSFHRIFDNHEVPLLSISYYAAIIKIGNCRDSIKQNLLKGTIPSSDDLVLLPSSIKEDIAALIFGLKDKKLASQLLYTEDFCRCLKNNSHEEVQKYYLELASSFWAILNNLIENDIKNFKFYELINSINCFHSFIDNQSFSISQEVSNVYKGIGKQLLDIEDWNIKSSDECNAILYILPYMKHDEFTRVFKIRMNSIHIKFEETENDKGRLEFKKRMDGLVNKINEILEFLQGETSIRITGDDKELTLLSIISDEIKPKYYSHIEIPLQIESFLSGIKQLILEGSLDEEDFECLTQLYCGNKELYINLPHSLSEVLSEEDLLTAYQIFRFFFYNRNDEQTIKVINNQFTSGVFHNFLFKAHEKKKMDLLALSLAMVILNKGSLSITTPTSMTNEGEKIITGISNSPENYLEVLKAIASLIKEYQCESDWIKQALTNKSLKLLTNSVIAEYSGIYTNEPFIVEETYFNNWDTYQDLLNDNSNNTLVDVYKNSPTITQTSFWKNPDQKYIPLYIHVLSSEFTKKNLLENQLINWINNLQSESLNSFLLLSDFSKLVRILYQDKPKKFSLGVNLHTILMDYFRNIDNSSLPTNVIENWFLFKHILNSTHKKVLEIEFLEELLSDPKKLDSRINLIEWDSYSLQDYNQHPLFLRKLFVEQILDKPTIEKLNIIKTVLTKHPNLLRKRSIPEQDREVFFERLSALIQTDDDNIKSVVQEILGLIKQI